ncbi:2,4-dihydroxyhept-2-ene-1,7-dioic acid aldolase [Acidocella aquatica]|uniref:2,4-dihydroxyhept-2-ene-1,7-dioic acid aldolase n=1 Tax=Acidocella aquatica TaxID=1922313 RepID=A0ABQ6AAG8_9PROT|nr:aldolase/citrate lyase family protein [Acidocella aquatica]GLR67124.1 2,4-dihydroxyhept-2-ene-1,7-dioic acid aldolase [Acidocella aquatica]
MSLKQKWRAGEKILNGWLAIPDSFSAETMAHQGWDSLTIDMQHGVTDYLAAVRMLTAISTRPVIPVVRVPWREPGVIMKMLDAGALGIICPMINSAADAADFVSCLRYPPLGQRSFGPIRALLAHGGDYGSKANELVTGFAMIETQAALDNLDAILATPGLDAIYIGPADLALALGATPRFDPVDERVIAAVHHVLARARHHGVYAGIHNATPEYAARMAALGFDFVTIGSDARFMAAGAAAAVGAFRATPLDAPSNGY